MQQNNTSQAVQEVRNVTWIGMFTNLGLAAVKFVVGYLGDSQAVIADGVHSLSDISTDFAVILGVKFWSAPPDEHHPYGHGRIEALITAAIGFALAFVAFGLSYESLQTIHSAHIRQTAWIAIIGPLLSIIVKEILYHWTVKVGKRSRSRAVIANAWHHRSDAFSSIPAVLAVATAGIRPDWAFVDHIGALIIAVFILKVAWDITVPALQELTDRGVSRKEQEMIKRITMAVPGVQATHAIRTRKLGANVYVDLHIQVDPVITVREGHNVSGAVKQALLEQGPEILDVIVHVEPNE